MTNPQLAKWLGVFSLIISGCDVYQPAMIESGRFYFSNDTENDFTFFINHKSLVIPKNTTGSILLEPGAHTMTTKGNETIQFIVYPGNKGGILNPQKQFYYAYSFIHGTNGIPSIYHLTIQHLIVNHYQLSGKIHSSNDFVIDNNVFNCDFAIGGKVPEELTEHTGVSQVKTKCFSHQELLNMITADDALISQLSVRSAYPNEKESVTLRFDYPVAQPNFNNKDLQIYAQDIIELVNDFRTALDPNKKQFYYNQYHRKVSNMAKIYSQMGSEGRCLKDKQKYAIFINQTRAIFGAGALLLN